MKQITSIVECKTPFGFPVEPDVYKIKRGSSEFCSLISHSLDCFETSSSYQISVLLSKYSSDPVLLTTIIFFILS